jgi:KaiC/GvpD/RAD55 family RecA-like ATPase
MTTERIAELVKKSRIDLTGEITEPPVALTIKNRTFATLYNFSVVTGQPKAKKTFKICLSITAALSNNVQGIIAGNLPPDKRKVILFDTEQSKAHVLRTARRICKLINTELPDNFLVYSLREWRYKERKALIEQVIATEKNIGLVVIDGIKDLVASINSEEEATEIADMLLRLTAKYGIHIITVLHQNKGTETLRGHIGTELQNKAETVVMVKKDVRHKNRSRCEAVLTRDEEFEPFEFYIDENGLPIIDVDAVVNPTQMPAVKPGPGEVSNITLENVLLTLEKDTPYKRDQIVAEIGKALLHCTRIQYGQKKIAEYLEYFVSTGAILIQGKRKSPSIRYIVTGNKT